MPTAKLVFVKLLLELADDPRFTMQLNDSQKLDYLLLLLMAGLTHNEIPPDPQWFKSRFHLEKTAAELEQNINKIREVYKKIIVYKGNYKFKNFKQLHNYVYRETENSLGILKEFYKNSTNKVNLFLIISSLISFYISLKNYKEEDVDMRERNRYGKRIKELLVKAKGDEQKAREAMEWVSQQGYVDWTLETVINKFNDYQVKDKKMDGVPESMRKFMRKD